MSMGLPVIATNWSGTTEFLDSSVGYPLKHDGLEQVLSCCIILTLMFTTYLYHLYPYPYPCL